MVLFGFGSILGARPAAGQLQGLPVHFNPKGGTGITIAGDFGRTVSNTVGGITSAQKPSTIGGRVSLGLPFITVGLGAGVYDPKVTAQTNELQYMGTMALKVFGAPLIPVAVSLQAGAGFLKVGTGTFATKAVNVPVGLGIALNVPTPGASIEPWVAGRVQVNSVSTGTAGGATTSGTQLGYGASGGINLGLPIGVGVHVALDWVSYAAKLTSPIASQRNKIERMTLGIGLHYSLKLPGLPGVPIVPGI